MTSALAAVALAAIACCTALVAALHVLPTGYAPLRNAVSDYGVGRYANWYRAQTTAAAIGAIALAWALARSVHPRPVGPIALLVVFAAARLAITRYPTDLDRTKPTPAGHVHLFLAVVAFASIALAAGRLAARVDWGGVDALGLAVIVTAVATALTVRLRFAWFGLVERLFYAAFLAWLATVAIHLL